MACVERKHQTFHDWTTRLDGDILWNSRCNNFSVATSFSVFIPRAARNYSPAKSLSEEKIYEENGIWGRIVLWRELKRLKRHILLLYQLWHKA